uniref:RNase H type-1 domain-containing protein n=1 Tax=Cannabis sativa TaxID=3483 RepID=A0A803PD29_CANSA
MAWESIGHALFSCCHAKAVWQITGFEFNFKRAGQMKDGDYFMYLSKILTKSELERVIYIMWFIWSDQNNFIHGKQIKKPVQILSQDVAYLENFRHFNNAVKPDSVTAAAPPDSTLWQPPPENKLKMNVDTAVDSLRSKIGIGVIIRDSNGCVVATMSKSVVGNYKSQEMEAKAMFSGLHWAEQLQLQHHNVKTDCLMVVNALNGQM